MSFAKSLSIADEMTDEINREARALGINLLNGLTRVTPVDTGRARGNWFVGINQPVRTIKPTRRSQESVNDARLAIKNAEAIQYPTIIISNNLPYIIPLNEGHSTQAPAKFVELAIQKVNNG